MREITANLGTAVSIFPYARACSTQETITMLKRFFAYYKPYRRLFALDMLASLTVALIGIAYPVITRSMLNTLIPERNRRMIIICGCLLLGIYCAKMALNFFIQFKGHVMGVRMQAQMRRDLFEHLERLPYSFYDNHETGKIMSRMTNDLMDVSELAHHGPENILICGISVLVSFSYLFTINPSLTLIIFFCVPLLFLLSLKYRKRMKRAFTESKKSVANINASLENSISGIRVTKAYVNAEKEAQKFEIGNQEFIDAKCDAYRAMGAFHSTTAFVTDVFNVIVLMAGGMFLSRGRISFGDYSAFIVSINLFINPLTTLINFTEQYQNGVAGFERFLEILDHPPEYENPEAVDIGRIKGNIEFRNVGFAYDQEGAVLSGVSLGIGAGETVALVGPSGGGKTTMCHLIPNFYQIDSGEILLDGVNINDIKFDSLRRNIGIVQQDVYLFNASIRENILYGRLDATEDEIVEAAKRANIHDYVMTLENGYDTVIGERGVRLSGGQKQRLSIARVFLKNPSILILDEATSALDNTTEVMIQQSLDELCKGRTTLVVAHRLSTIKNADKIAVIAEGKVMETGTHDELMRSDGIYRDLYTLQYKGISAA